MELNNYKIINADQLENDLSLLGDVIREKTGESKLFSFPEGFKEACQAIKTADFNNLIMGTLERLESEKITKIGEYALFWQNSIKSLYLPNVTLVDSNGCCYCHNLEIAEIGATTIKGNGFFGCEKLKTLILRAPSMCVLEATGAFGQTPFNTDGQSGTIYVPEDLVEIYRRGTNWGALNATYTPIEGSEYEL